MELSTLSSLVSIRKLAVESMISNKEQCSDVRTLAKVPFLEKSQLSKADIIKG